MKGMKRTTAAIAAIALSAGVIAGCGSSSEGGATSAAEQVESTTTAALTQAEYVASANAICGKIAEVTEPLNTPADSETPEQAQAALEKAVAGAKAGVAELTALVPPAELATAHATFVETSSASIELGSKLISALLSGNLDDPGLEADAREAEALEQKLVAAEKELGLSNCMSGGLADDTDGSDG